MNFNTAKDISRMLAARVESVCRYLLPAGKQVGSDWCAGSVDGDAGKSLKVCLRGDKAGVWADFSSETDKGDILDLWRTVRRQTMPDAFRDASKWLGIWHAGTVEKSATFAKPNKAGVKKLDPAAKVFAYLEKERRLIPAVLTDYKVSEKDGQIVFPYLSPAGELMNIKHLAIERGKDGKKQTKLEKGCALTLFGWQSIKDGTKELLICEGELDAITWHQFGFAALSVPNGCTNTNWIDLEWDNLAPLDTIYLSYDMDEAGQAGVKKIAERLGLHRCYVVALPHKDANECLQKGCCSGDAASWIANAKSLRPPEICDPSFFRNEVQEFFYPSGVRPTGFTSKIMGDSISFRPGEVTLFTGISSHGKSTFWSNLLVEAASKGLKSAVASLEIPPAVTLAIMAKQWHGIEKPESEQLDSFLSSMTGRIWVFDIFGIAEPPKLLSLCEYSRARFDVDFVVIDSLMKLRVAGDDYEAQRLLLNDLAGFAVKTRCHVFLIAHPRKISNESQHVGKMDVKGSSDIFNQADNVIAIWRNREKEQKNEGKNNGERSGKENADVIACVEKQRMTGMEFRRNLWFLPECKQFKPNSDEGATYYSL